jgi:PPOX class probable F420-dependent enzyme
MTDINPALEALLASGHQGVLVTLRKDGRPQLSNITYGYADGVARISVTDGRAKSRNLRRDPRASLYTTSPDFWKWVVADGTAELTPPAADPNDATVEALISYYRDISGEHPDWDEYRAAMVADKRLLVTLRVERIYGQPPR